MKTKGELVTACIKLMFDNGEAYIDPTNVSFTLQDGETTPTGSDIEAAEYAHRTANIIEAINRAFYRIYSYGKIPNNEMVIGTAEEPLSAGKLFSTYNLNSIANDFGRVVKLAYVDNNTGIYNYNIPITYLAGGKVVLPTIYQVTLGYNKNGYYSLLYERKVKELKYDDADTLDLTTYGYTEDMLAYIPYFVKADLYEEDNPQMAQASRNIFEAFIQGLPSNDTDTYNVEDVMNVW